MNTENPVLPIRFALIIRATQNPNGSLADYSVHGESDDLPEEIIVALTRNWLRMIEENYYARFAGKPN